MDIPASLRSNQLSLDNRFKVTENADESDGSSFSEDDNGPGQDKYVGNKHVYMMEEFGRK